MTGTEDNKLVSLVDRTEFGSDEAQNAKDYWSSRDFDFYKKHRPWTDFIATEIIAMKPRSVFELGCNAGKNLLALRKRNPELFVAGADVNKGAVEYGRKEGSLRLICSDETVLDVIPNEAFDVSFTVSVLDHVPEPAGILQNLGRMSKVAIVLLEPFTGEEGKVVRNVNAVSGAWTDTTPYSYSWDYARLATQLFPSWKLEVRDFTLDTNLGRFYKVYKLLRP